MDSGNILEANSVVHIDRLDVGQERKGEIKDVSYIYGLSFWGRWFSCLLRWQRLGERQGSYISQKEERK